MPRPRTLNDPLSRLDRMGAAVGASVARAMPQDRTILLVLAVALVLLAALSLVWGQTVEQRLSPPGGPGEGEVMVADPSAVFALGQTPPSLARAA